MKVHLGGSLAWHDELKRSNLEINIPEAIPLSDLLRKLAIPRGEIAIISINGELFEGEDGLIRDADVIQLYPPIGGGSK